MFFLNNQEKAGIDQVEDLMSCDVVVRTSIGWCSSQKRALYSKRSQAVSATNTGNQGPKIEIRSRTHGCLSVSSLVFMSRLLGLAHEGARLHFRLSLRTRRKNQNLLFATTAICSLSIRRPGGGNHNGERLRKRIMCAGLLNADW